MGWKLYIILPLHVIQNDRGLWIVVKFYLQKLIFSVWARTAEIRKSVTTKRLKLQQARQARKINSVLRTQVTIFSMCVHTIYQLNSENSQAPGRRWICIHTHRIHTTYIQVISYMHTITTNSTYIQTYMHTLLYIQYIQTIQNVHTYIQYKQYHTIHCIHDWWYGFTTMFLLVWQLWLYYSLIVNFSYSY